MWLPLLFGVLSIAIQALLAWGVVAMSSAGRTSAWYGMLTGILLYLLPQLAQFIGVFLSMPGIARQTLLRATEVGPVVFAVAFAAYAGRLVLLARRAAALEAECASLAAAIGGGPQPGMAPASYPAPQPR